MNCLRLYAKKSMSPGKFMACEELFDSLTAGMSDWALFPVLWVLTLHIITTSALEGEHSVMRRKKNGGWGLGANSALTAILDKNVDGLAVRRAERDLALYKRASSAAVDTCPESLQVADRQLQLIAFKGVRAELELAHQYDVEFLNECPGVHWKVSRRDSASTLTRATTIGPSFRRVRIVVLCRSVDGVDFLLCSCFLFQRMLYLCRHMLAVKRRTFELYEDVFFRWHIAYAMDKKVAAAMPARSCRDGQQHGAGVVGIPVDELVVAQRNVPPSRTSCQAWIAEGALQWIPHCKIIWGKISRDEYLRHFSEPSWERDEYDGYDDSGPIGDDHSEQSDGRMLRDCLTWN